MSDVDRWDRITIGGVDLPPPNAWTSHSHLAPPGLAGILAFLGWICRPSHRLKFCRCCDHLTGLHAGGLCVSKGCACEMCPHGWYQGNDCETCNPLPY